MQFLSHHPNANTPLKLHRGDVVRIRSGQGKGKTFRVLVIVGDVVSGEFCADGKGVIAELRELELVRRAGEPKRKEKR